MTSRRTHNIVLGAAAVALAAALVPAALNAAGTQAADQPYKPNVEHGAYQGKRDQLSILFITIDGERKKAAQKSIDENKITLPVLLLLKEKCMDQYGVRGWVPQTFLIDREGMLLGKIVGQRDWGSSEAWSCMKELFSLR